MPCQRFLAACMALTVASLLLMAVAWQSERTGGFGIGSAWTQARVHRGEVELWCIELEDSRVADVLRKIEDFKGFAGYFKQATFESASRVSKSAGNPIGSWTQDYSTMTSLILLFGSRRLRVRP